MGINCQHKIKQKSGEYPKTKGSQLEGRSNILSDKKIQPKPSLSVAVESPPKFEDVESYLSLEHGPSLLNKFGTSERAILTF